MNHFQSRSCSKSQILIDWVTYRYFFLKFVVSESSRTSSILSDPLLRIVMNPHRSKIFPCFYTKQITRNPNSNMEQIFSMRLKDWCSKQCIAAEFLSFAEYLHVFSCKSCKSCIPQIRNTSWKFQKQSGAKVTQKWQKDTKTIMKQLLKFWTNNKNKEIHMWYTETTQWPELRLTGSFNFTSIFFHLATTTTATMHLFSQPFVSIFCWKMTETHGTQMILIVEAFVRVEIPTWSFLHSNLASECERTFVITKW